MKRNDNSNDIQYGTACAIELNEQQKKFLEKIQTDAWKRVEIRLPGTTLQNAKKLFPNNFNDYFYNEGTLKVECNPSTIKEGIDKEKNREKVIVYGNGVVIDDVLWAKCNVGEKGKFVALPTDYGEYYTWEKAQNSLPKGWRLPTIDEIETLLQAPHKWQELDGVCGRLFGSGNNTIFLPAAGKRNSDYGTLDWVGWEGDYWSATWNGNFYARKLSFYSDSAYTVHRAYRKFGCSIRCVAE